MLVMVLPFLPNPLEAKVGHVHGKPLREAFYHLRIQSILERPIELADRLSNRGSDGGSRQFTQFRDQSGVVQELVAVARFRQQECSAKDGLGVVSGQLDNSGSMSTCLNDSALELPILARNRLHVIINQHTWLWFKRARWCPFRILQ